MSIVQANARHLPLADNTVDLICTSPPYFALRSYTDGGEHYAGQIGDEPTPAEFVDSLLDVTRECMRVLKPSGSLWVNLGDKYATTSPPGSGGTGAASRIQTTHPGSYTPATPDSFRRPDNGGARPKSLIGIPWRYTLRCIDELGLILRAEVIWSKPNGLPESVTDRVRRSHEQWFHLTLQPRYFSAVDEIREAHIHPLKGGGEANGRHDRGMPGFGRHSEQTPHPLGKLPGSVWTIPTEPLKVPDHLGIDHFAAFPTEWPRRIIQGWSPAGVCVECGEGRRPVVDKSRVHTQRTYTGSRGAAGVGNVTNVGGDPWLPGRDEVTITGYACACPEPTAHTTPAVVLDPFGGTGTTALVAEALGRRGISVDMSADYCRLAAWRTTDPDQLAKASRVEKPPKQVAGQAELFDLLEGSL